MEEYRNSEELDYAKDMLDKLDRKIKDVIAYRFLNEDYKELTLAKGVGTKLAQKIILELRDKLIKANIAPVKPDDPLIETQASKDTFSVLQSLGYEYDEIKSSITVVSSRLSNPNDSEELLRECLKHLSM